jgi:hypothetical protein
LQTQSKQSRLYYITIRTYGIDGLILNTNDFILYKKIIEICRRQAGVKGVKEALQQTDLDYLQKATKKGYGN